MRRCNYHLGTALLGLKRYGQAEAALQRAVTLRPSDAGALNNLGNALAGSGRHDEAIACYRQVLAADAGHVPARFNLGRSLAALDRLEEAVASFQRRAGGCSWISIRIGWPTYTPIWRGAGRSWALRRGARRVSRHRRHRPQVAAWNESLILLLLGRYAEGWREVRRPLGHRRP